MYLFFCKGEMEPNKQKGLKKTYLKNPLISSYDTSQLSNDKQKLREIHDFYMHVQEPIMNGKV
jgi:hypothetical protein